MHSSAKWMNNKVLMLTCFYDSAICLHIDNLITCEKNKNNISNGSRMHVIHVVYYLYMYSVTLPLQISMTKEKNPQ